MYYPLNNNEVYDLVARRARVLSHEEIKKYKNIDDMLGPSRNCVIMYVTNFDGKNAMGHWCYLQKKGGVYYYFDPYGYAPDEPLRQMDPGAVRKFGGGTPLTDMLNKSGLPWYYSTAQLQNRKGNSKVCGRLVALRAKHRDMGEAEFAAFMGPDAEAKSVALTDKFI